MPSGSVRPLASSSAATSAMASSMAILVPEPTEKCAVCAASPSRATAVRLKGPARCRHRCVRQVRKLPHRELFTSSGQPSIWVAKSFSR